MAFQLYNTCVCVCVRARVHSVMSNSLQSMDCSPPFLCPWNFSRRGYWSELPFPPPGDLPHRGIKPTLFCLLHWQGGSLPLMPPGLMILKFWLCSSICWLNLWSEYTLLVSVKKWLLRLSIHTEERHRSDVNFPSPSVGCNYFMWTKLTLVV